MSRIKLPDIAVKGEVEAVIGGVAKDLEVYFDNTEEKEVIKSCIERVHQVGGSLRLLEIKGGEVLAEEIENLLKAILSGSSLESQNVSELLVGALLFIPKYFDFAINHKQDIPLLVLSTVNLLRRSYGKGILTEHLFFGFTYDGDIESYPVNKLNTYSDVGFRAKRLRHMFQVGLLGVLQGGAIQTHVKSMYRAIVRLRKITGDVPFARIWDLGTILLEIIGERRLQPDSSIKSLLGAIDRQIKLVCDFGVGIGEKCPSRDIVSALLYYIIKSGVDNEKITTIKELYDINSDLSLYSEAELDEQRVKLNAPDKKVLKRVSEEILEKLAAIKDGLDQLDRIGDIADEEVSFIRDGIINVIATLSLLELNYASEIMKEIDSFVCKRLGQQDPHGEIMSVVADKIVVVEMAVNNYASGFDNGEGELIAESNYNDAKRLVVKEARINLDKIKNTIEGYMDSYMDAEQIADMPLLLDEVKGALFMLDFNKAAEIIAKCSRYVKEGVIYSRIHPKDVDIDTLTDALVGIEWYLESFEQYDRADSGLLDVASESIDELVG